MFCLIIKRNLSLELHLTSLLLVSPSLFLRLPHSSHSLIHAQFEAPKTWRALEGNSYLEFHETRYYIAPANVITATISSRTGKKFVSAIMFLFLITESL